MLSSMRRRVVALFMMLALVAIAGAPPAFAQESEHAVDPDDEEARTLFREGEAAYGDGRFEEALDRFERAYELSQRVALLYNIGLAAMNVGKDHEALEAFRGYLAGDADLPNRAIVEARVATLERRIAEQAEEEERLREAQARTSGAPGVGWALTIAGGALIAGGAVVFTLGVLDYDAVESAQGDTDWSSVSDAYDRAPILTGAGIAGAGLGAALLVAGVVLVATADSGPVDVAVGPGGLAIGGRL
jgi:tetratricopeptide (TPR) repeat protein